jgi:cell division inhibitor SepF
MGALRKTMQYLGLVDTGEEDDYLDEEESFERAPARRYESVPTGRDARGDGRAEPRSSAAPVARRSFETRTVGSAGSGSSAAVAVDEGRLDVSEEVPGYRITTLQPRSYNEARQLGEEFRDGTPVIMNLTEMDDGDAKRLVDFAAGLIFGLRGTIEKVTNKVFLLSPSNVDVSAEDKRRIREGGFYNQS